MNKHSLIGHVLCWFLLLGSASLAAAEVVEHKQVFKLKTGDAETVVADVSDLAVGESETIVSDSGRTVDLLRTEEGFEVYIDGELQEMGRHDARLVKRHKKVEVICDSEDNCDERVMISSDGEESFDDLHDEHGVHVDEEVHKVIVIDED